LVPIGSVAHKSLERQAAYKIASKEISEWQDTINSNRTAKQLDLTKELPPVPTIEVLTKDPNTDALRQEINEALNIPDTIEPNIDNLPQKSKLRSQMFHQYQKQKRIAKIKSKLYHKIRNKRKDKSNGVPIDEEEKIQQENLLRIEERISLRHSAKRLKKTLGRYARDEEKKKVSENENLRQRIRNPSRVNSDGIVTYDSSSDDDENFLADQLELELDTDKDQKGIFGMKFMQEAVKRQREKEKNLTEDLLNDLSQENSKFKFNGEPQKKRKTDKKFKIDSEKQEKLIEAAFETDEMDQIAAEEWAKDQQEKNEKVPKTLNGWGSWFGSGIKQKKSEPSLTVYKVDKVIKNEERDTRAAKYLVKKIPFPYKTSRQFDAVHKIPIGKEWNSKRVYQKQIAPDILTRPGEIIDPISK
jgi:U3 small nucleolar RNA-associated protein 14